MRCRSCLLTLLGILLISVLSASCSPSAYPPPKGDGPLNPVFFHDSIAQDRAMQDVIQPDGNQAYAPFSLPYSGYDADRVIPIPKENLFQDRIPVLAKGIYVTGWSLRGSRFNQLVNLVDETELNAMVIDLKDDTGYFTYPTAVPLAREIGADTRPAIQNMREIIAKLNQKGIYTIARIVVFKDPYLPGARPEWALQKKEGGIWRNSKGMAWVDPYRKEVWEYHVAIAREAADMGFREVQFDYVRFPENGKKVDSEVSYQDRTGMQKDEVIRSFLDYAKSELRPYPVFIAADLFGLTTSVQDDMGIGQNWDTLASVVDVLCPMMYPSHYANRTYDLPVPDAYPYETISHGLQDALAKNERLQKAGVRTGRIRPWLQDFTASWVKGHIAYGPEQVRQQIKAASDQGIEEYLIWNPSNRYSEGAWRE